MKHHTVIDHYLRHAEGKLELSVRQEIDRHLASCTSCAAVYGMLSRALAPETKPVRSLTPDPFLPTRIRALAEEQRRTARWARAARISFASLAFVIAVSTGILLGKDVATTATPANDMATEFASSIAASDLGDQWYSAMDNGNGGQQ